MILQQRGHFPEEVETGPPEEEEAIIAEDLEEEAEPAVDLMKEAMAILEDRGMMPLGAGEEAMEVDASDSLAAESAEVAMESAAEIGSEAKAGSEVEAEVERRRGCGQEVIGATEHEGGLVLKLSPSFAAKKKAEVDEKIKAEPDPMRPKPPTSFPSRMVFEGARRVEPTPLYWNLVQRGMKAIGAAPESASGASASGTSASGASASGTSASRLHTL